MYRVHSTARSKSTTDPGSRVELLVPGSGTPRLLASSLPIRTNGPLGDPREVRTKRRRPLYVSGTDRPIPLGQPEQGLDTERNLPYLFRCRLYSPGCYPPIAHRVALIPNEASPSDVGQGSLNGDAPRRIEPARWVGNWRTASVRWVRYYPKA